MNRTEIPISKSLNWTKNDMQKNRNLLKRIKSWERVHEPVLQPEPFEIFEDEAKIWASHKNEFVLLSINFWFESLSDMPTVNIFFPVINLLFFSEFLLRWFLQRLVWFNFHVHTRFCIQNNFYFDQIETVEENNSEIK